MHWVWATDAHTHQRIPVNLSAIPTMVRAKNPDGSGVTILFLGGLAIAVDGKQHYAQTHVRETPEELLAAPSVIPPSLKPTRAPAKNKGSSE